MRRIKRPKWLTWGNVGLALLIPILTIASIPFMVYTIAIEALDEKDRLN